MKVNISRQNVYMIVLTILFLILIMLFAFLVLIPNGKTFREQKKELTMEQKDLQRYEDFHAKIQNKLKTLQSQNRHIISAFESSFNPSRFIGQYKKYFTTLNLSPKNSKDFKDKDFVLYEVNTTSNINSPSNFYKFLEAINKGDWVIKVNFPIEFKRDGESISSSFTMQVYGLSKKK